MLIDSQNRLWIHVRSESDWIGVIKRCLLLQERVCTGLQSQIQNCNWELGFWEQSCEGGACLWEPEIGGSHRPCHKLRPISHMPMGLLRTTSHRLMGLSINKAHLSYPNNGFRGTHQVELNSTMFVSSNSAQRALIWIDLKLNVRKLEDYSYIIFVCMTWDIIS